MRQSTASNLAIVLAILAWPLVIYGVMSQLGDYHPSVPQEIITANQRTSIAILSAGFLCFMGALWLAGYGFTGARIRSLFAAACCLGLVSFGIVGVWL